MHALVTGAGGFLGLYIVEQLVARGDRVRAFCRGQYAELDQLGVETFRGDVRDAEAVARACCDIDVVFHTAAVAGLGFDWNHFHGINTLGTYNVIAGCRRYGVGRLVYTSSPSVTFDGSDQCGVDESVPYPRRWLAHYPRSKALAERAVLKAGTTSETTAGLQDGDRKRAGTGHHDGPPLLTCALRPHLMWGPRDTHLFPRLVERARRGQLRRVGDGTNLIDTTYVENAAEAHLQAADALKPGSLVAGRAYFISQGEPVHCWQWIDELLALAGQPGVTKTASLKSASRVGAVFEAVYRLLRIKGEPPMTRFLAAQLATSHYFDLTRARQDFGFAPRISNAEGMRRLAANFPPLTSRDGHS